MEAILVPDDTYRFQPSDTKHAHILSLIWAYHQYLDITEVIGNTGFQSVANIANIMNLSYSAIWNIKP